MGLLITLSGALWAILARIPVSVQGIGVLLPVSSINSSLSGTDGHAIWIFNQPKQPWHESARLFKDRPDQFNDQQIIELTKDIISALDANKVKETSSAQTKSSSQKYNQRVGAGLGNRKLSAGRLLLWIQSSSQKEQLVTQLNQLERTLLDTKSQQHNINSKQAILRHELDSRSLYLTNMKKLASKGFVSHSQILQEQSQVDNLLSQIYTNKNDLIGLSKQLNQSYQKLSNELAKLINQQMIFTMSDKYLSQVIPNNGEYVTKGQIVLELSTEPLDSPIHVPVFLSSKEMAQVFPGMKALATPTGYKRSEVGGIRGQVVSMAHLPSGLEYITARVGLKSLAQVIINREPSPTLAVLALERTCKHSTNNSGGYRWSSHGDLPFPPTPGDRLEVEITTRRVAPIELVLPTLRRFFGLTPPQRPDNQHKDKT